MDGTSLSEDLKWTEITIYMGFAAFSILIWDHVVTFGDEVELLWKGNHGLFTHLFFLNRYITPLGFVVNLFAYLSPSWTDERCQRFVRYEGSMTVIGINITALMMLLRIRALYTGTGRLYVLAVVVVVLVAQLGVNAWLLTKGTAVVHDRYIHSCTMIFDPSVGWVASASAWLPLLYDSIILALTFFRTYTPFRRKEGSQLFKRLLEDGILYYSVIFSVTLILTVMIVVASDGLKNLMAQMELLLTVTMMSRVTLNLKKEGRILEEEQIIPIEIPLSATSRQRATAALHDVELQFIHIEQAESSRCDRCRRGVGSC